jgi:nicotinate-nucleotide adenylyltransferase
MAMVKTDPHLRIGIFGGSFDPIHCGHVRVAEAAVQTHRLDQLLLVPARRQPHKKQAPAAPDEDRMAMVRLVCTEHPGFIASDCELRRPAPSYTIDTLRQLQDQFGADHAWFLIVGSDSIRDLPQWRSIETLAQMCTLVVAARPEFALDTIDALEPCLGSATVQTIKAAAIRDTDVQISSTQIRNRVAAGRRIEGLVPPCVGHYIIKNKLYRTPKKAYPQPDT